MNEELIGHMLSVPVYEPLPQGHFLQAMGLKERLVRLLERNRRDPEKAKRIQEAALGLFSPSGTGSQYSGGYQLKWRRCLSFSS